MIRPTCLFLMPAILFAAFASPAPADEPQAPSTIMARPGKLLADDALQESDWKKNWKAGKGDWKFKEGVVCAAEIPAQNHHTGAGRSIEIGDAVIQFDFRLDGAKWLGLGLDATAKEGSDHVARVRATPNSIYAQAGSGWGPTTKLAKLAEKKTEFAPGTWHTVTIERAGDELIVHLDGKPLLYARDPAHLKKPVNRLALISGGEWASFRNVRVWEARPADDWEKRREKTASALGR